MNTELVLKMKKNLEISLKKPLLIFILLSSIIGTLFSTLYLVVNLNEIPGKITKTTTLENKTPPKKVGKADGYSPGLLKKTVDLFKKITIDLSAVTPLLLFLFFYSAFTGTLKLLVNRKKSGTDVPDYYPFPKNYETTWIQLGFIGTLWAFFIIGLRMAKIKNVGGVELVDILTKAFGTAIVSTLTAVVMVYIFCPTLKKGLRWIFDIQIRQPINAIDKRLNELSDKISLACAETEKSQDSIIQLGEHISNCSKKIETFSLKIEELSEAEIMNGITNIQKPLNVIEKQMGELSATITKLGETSENQVDVLNGLKEKADETMNKEGEKVENLQNISKNLQTFADNFDSKLDKIIEAFKTENQKRQKDIVVAQENFREKVNRDNRFTIKKIKNILLFFIKKTKSSIQENMIQTQTTIDRLNTQNRTFLETEFSRITDEIENMCEKIDEIEQYRKSAEKKMNTLNDKFKELKLEKKKEKGKASWQNNSSVDAEEE